MRTPDYLQVVGFINQTLIDLAANDTGGEMDPHGDDSVLSSALKSDRLALTVIQRGNPLGGIMYSNGFPSNGGNNNTFQQVDEWNK
jgi:hypothetical protein